MKRDFDRGRKLFGEAQCFACHRFDNEGGANGPDLTIVSGLRNKPGETPEPHAYIESTWLNCVKPWEHGVSGPDAMFESGRQLRFTDVTDGLSSTVMVVEAGEPIPWAKPGDYPFDAKKPLPKLAAPGMGDLCHELLGDGLVLRVNTRKTPEKTLKLWFQRNDGMAPGDLVEE